VTTSKADKQIAGTHQWTTGRGRVTTATQDQCKDHKTTQQRGVNGERNTLVLYKVVDKQSSKSATSNVRRISRYLCIHRKYQQHCL